jgi:hypothetical protein
MSLPSLGHSTRRPAPELSRIARAQTYPMRPVRVVGKAPGDPAALVEEFGGRRHADAEREVGVLTRDAAHRAPGVAALEREVEDLSNAPGRRRCRRRYSA